MKIFKLISIHKLDEMEWAEYYSLSQKFDGINSIDLANAVSEIEHYKKSRFDDYEINKDRHQNEKVIFEGSSAMGWLVYRVDRGGSSFDFNSIHNPVPPGFMKLILKDVYEFLQESNENASNFWTFDRNRIEVMKNISAPVFEEMMISSISRCDMDPQYYEQVITQTNVAGYELRFLNDIPEELLDKYVKLRNDISEDMASLKPVKHLNKKWTRKDIKRMAESDKLQGAMMHMYMLIDSSGEIAAFCSLYTDEDNPEIIRQSGGLTAVARTHRGRGFAAYLKAKMYLKLLNENKTFKFVETDTMPWNTYMYRINEKFGFKPKEYGSEFKLTKQFLENYLNLN